MNKFIKIYKKSELENTSGVSFELKI